jgi:DNA-directed RNA polymerase I subunit RPA1
VFKIQTEGVNFHKVWSEDFVDHASIHSNDIQAIKHFYGIEAGRNSIIEQIKSVFDVYHIQVDFRHLSLIADYMSFSGSIKAMNRTGMNV